MSNEPAAGVCVLVVSRANSQEWRPARLFFSADALEDAAKVAGGSVNDGLVALIKLRDALQPKGSA